MPNLKIIVWCLILICFRFMIRIFFIELVLNKWKAEKRLGENIAFLNFFPSRFFFNSFSWDHKLYFKPPKYGKYHQVKGSQKCEYRNVLFKGGKRSNLQRLTLQKGRFLGLIFALKVCLHMREEKLVLREINCGLRVGSNSCKVKFGVMVYKGWDGCLKHTVIT